MKFTDLYSPALGFDWFDLNCHSFSLTINDPFFVGMHQISQSKSLLCWRLYKKESPDGYARMMKGG